MRLSCGWVSNVFESTIFLVPSLPGWCLGVQSYNWNNEGNFLFIVLILYLLPTCDTNYCSVSTSVGVSRGRGGSVTGWDLAPSLIIARQRRHLLIIAGDVEINPGPTAYSE